MQINIYKFKIHGKQAMHPNYTNNKTKIDLQKPIKSEVLMSKNLEPET